MTPSRKFRAEDIGAELLPILTMGIYREPLDTLREYIQNAIDANARHVSVTITSDQVSIQDDGDGMSQQVAEKAIRLGMSDKDPRKDVGFRGIGIYSALNVCSCLEIHTRAATGPASRITFDFDEIRRRLRIEESHRLSGKSSRLSLIGLLEESVRVEECEPHQASQGTLVLMIGLKGNTYRQFTERPQVKEYLHSVVPLPFHPDFIHKAQLEKLFEKQDYRTVDLTLILDGESERLYRPYHNSMFHHGRGYGPETYKLSNVIAKGPLGFAWVCLNDDRKKLPAADLRGLVIKKFGFSVGSREFCARFFTRPIFNERISGEVIITHPELLPNAARTEFEAGDIRDTLYMELDKLASLVSSWGDKIQSQLKAQEELQDISPEAFEIAKSIPEQERDIEALLQFNTTLTSFRDRLKLHEKYLKEQSPDLLQRTLATISQAQRQIREVLSRKGKTRHARLKRIDEALEIESKAPTPDELPHAKERPTSVVGVVGSTDVELTPDVRDILRFLDDQLRLHLSQLQYSQLITALAEHLEESR